MDDRARGRTTPYSWTLSTHQIVQQRLIKTCFHNHGRGVEKHLHDIAQSEQVYAPSNDIGDKKMMEQLDRFTDQMNARLLVRTTYTSLNGYTATCR
ncbi:hypothetical protein [Magnetovibrio blakemorei]|uniref:hypothetical protein n=1 Tax=Magnetovibrio blakemorei TaxID=28181 RepID=UPI001112DDD4|nr:hypothetical protein [Magnetovibrio blakemorei]